jgi:hypothetical protein
MRLVRGFVATGTLVLLVMASGCGSSVTTSGKNIKEYFVVTDGWFWQYTNTDSSDLYEMWSLGEAEREGQTVNVFGWKFADNQALAEDELASPPELFFMESYWSKDEDGVLFWGSGDGDGTGHDDIPWTVEFLDPPLQFGTTDMYPGSTEDGGTSGLNWTSEYVEDVADLDTGAGLFEDVMHIRFVDENESHPFAGDYWLARQAGIVQFQLFAHPDQIWNLKKYEN